jgi:hypothetical protein
VQVGTYPSSTGQESVRIHRLATSHGPVFLVNSRFPLVSAAPIPSHQQVVFKVGAPLLPKLRGHFAEFLNHNSLDRLSILYLITCVGLGYGRLKPRVDAFLGSIGSPNPPKRGSHQISGIMNSGFAYRSPYILRPGQPSPGLATFLRHTC